MSTRKKTKEKKNRSFLFRSSIALPFRTDNNSISSFLPRRGPIFAYFTLKTHSSATSPYYVWKIDANNFRSLSNYWMKMLRKNSCRKAEAVFTRYTRHAYIYIYIVFPPIKYILISPLPRVLLFQQVQKISIDATNAICLVNLNSFCFPRHVSGYVNSPLQFGLTSF